MITSATVSLDSESDQQFDRAAIKAWQRELGVYLARFQIGPSLQFKAKLLVLKQEFISVFS